MVSFRGQKKKSLGHAQIGFLEGFNSKFPTSIPPLSYAESPRVWDLSSKQFQQFSRKQYKSAKSKDPIDLMLHMHLPVTQSFKTA